MEDRSMPTQAAWALAYARPGTTLFYRISFLAKKPLMDVIRYPP